MADIFRGQSRSVGGVLALLSVLLFATPPTALAQLYEQPVLVIDPGMHTAPIKDAAVDEAGRVGVTASHDKTVRVWSLTDGKLIRTLRVPAGPGDIGKMYAVAITPDGEIIAAGGWTNAENQWIYLFDGHTGELTKRISSGATTHSLAFSSNGRYLAAGTWNSLHIYDRDRHWSEIFHDREYGDVIYGLTFDSEGRLATVSYDGKIRLYDSDFKQFVPPRKVTGGKLPFRISFKPDGTTLALGYNDVPVVELFDGHSLAPLPPPNLDGINGSRMNIVRFSKDGETLYAGGGYADHGNRVVLAWAHGGRGERRVLTAGRNTVAGIAALPGGGLFVASQDPIVEVLDSDDRLLWVHRSVKADFRNQESTLAVSADGTIVDFGFEQFGKSPLRFDLRSLKLTSDPPADEQTSVPRQTGLAIEGWNDGPFPTLDGKQLRLFPNEPSQSLSVHPDGKRFVLGADWSVRAFDAQGQSLWRSPVPGEAWTVNITGDGRLVVVGYGDGTIRWHRMDDGRELLALFVAKDRQNWVAWTPEGFYGATPGAFGLLQWHVNHGFDAAAETVAVSAIAGLRRPDALALVLQQMETARALGIADLKAARRNVQIATRSEKAPGAVLHVLTIGVSDYGDKAKNLRLKFADRDAQDVASALINTQDGGIYAEVKPQSLQDKTANKDGIFDALAAIERNMKAGDLAVIMFSGHGTVIDGQFYLVPYGADDSTPAHLKSSALPATEFQSEILKLATHGRVLVLLDACRSAGLIGAVSGADVLRSALAAGNVTVLTSSTADKVSREDEKWQHGAFSKIFLDALSSGDDIDKDHRGVISMAQLTAYMTKHLDELTGGDQQLGLEQRFEGDLFVSGL